MNPSIFMGSVLIHTWKITFSLKKYCMNVYDKASKKGYEHGQVEKQKHNLKKNKNKQPLQIGSPFLMLVQNSDCLVK